MGPRSEHVDCTPCLDTDSVKSLHFTSDLKTLTTSLGGNGENVFSLVFSRFQSPESVSNF